MRLLPSSHRHRAFRVRGSFRCRRIARHPPGESSDCFSNSGLARSALEEIGSTAETALTPIIHTSMPRLRPVAVYPDFRYGGLRPLQRGYRYR